MSNEKQPGMHSATLNLRGKGQTSEACLAGNLQQNKARKRDFKRMKKERKRSGKGTLKIDEIEFSFHIHFNHVSLRQLKTAIYNCSVVKPSPSISFLTEIELYLFQRNFRVSYQTHYLTH